MGRCSNHPSRVTPSWAPNPSEVSRNSLWTLFSKTPRPTLPTSAGHPQLFRLFAPQMSAKHNLCSRLTSSNPSTKTPMADHQELQHPDWYANLLYLTFQAHFLLSTTPCLQPPNRRNMSSNDCIRRSQSTSFNTLVHKPPPLYHLRSLLQGSLISRVASQSLQPPPRKPPSSPSAHLHHADTFPEYQPCHSLPLSTTLTSTSMTLPNMPSLSACMKCTMTASTIC